MKARQILSCSAVACAALFGASQATATVFSFNDLSGFSGDPYTTYSEAGYTFAKTSGSGCIAGFVGNPAPDVFVGVACDAQRTGTFKMTGGVFKLNSFDFRANFAEANYVVAGSLGSVPQFSFSGNQAASNSFLTVNSASNLFVDTLVFKLQATGTSLNIDNINLTAGETTAPVPEPETYAMLLLGLAAIGVVARRRG